MCVHPLPIRDPKTAKINLVPCGKCIECRKAYQNEWIFRLSQEMKHIAVPTFVTLTYDERNVPLGDNGNVTQSVLCKDDLQKFIKRLRKNGGDLCKNLKYFAVGEYGSKYNRCHFHLVLMAPHIESVLQMQQLVWKSWHFGFSKTRYCTARQIHYVCKYMNKLDDRKHLVKPFRLYSRGLGLCYLTAAMIKHYLTTFSRTCKNGKFDIPLPRYFRRKLDEVSLSDPFLKKYGVVYSELLQDIEPKEGTRFWFFRQFQKKLQYYSDYQKKYEENGFYLGLPAINVHYRSMFDNMYKSVDLLVNAEYESKRLIDKCKIRNGLVAVPPLQFSPNYEFALTEI